MDITKEIINSKDYRNEINDILRQVEQLEPTYEVKQVVLKLTEASLWLSHNILNLNNRNR